MKTDKAIEEIRRVRHRISARFGHDVRKLGEHYMKIQENYPGKFVTPRYFDSPETEYRIPVRKSVARVAEKRKKYG